jgi:transcriptional regulator with XRE-family HTH domain
MSLCACQPSLYTSTVWPMEGNGVDSTERQEGLGPVSLGRFIERCRMSRGMKQGELAAKAGVNPSYLSSVEAGQRKWPQVVVPKIAAALGIHQAFFAYEAGVITEDPSTLSGGVLFGPSDPRAEVVELLTSVHDEDMPAVKMVVERLARRDRG